MKDDRPEDDSRWEQIERLYHLVLEQPAETRDQFLRKACEGDDGLRREVASLLAYDSEEPGVLDAPAVAIVARAIADDGRAQVLEPGRALGHYRLVRRIGRGGMGEVFLADDLSLHRRVALKFLPPELAKDSHATARLHREARAASALAHPNIVTVHSIDAVEGLTFIAMEYVEGDTLKERITRGSFPLSEVIEIGAQVADALAAAHGVGLIHRDIKPANIVITGAGQAKVLDFGIAKRWDATDGPQESAAPTAGLEVTATGLIYGTVSYLSPEQARGDPIDPRSDVFSLGAVLYEAATGARPFTGPDAAAIIRHITTTEPQPPSRTRAGLPPEFDRVIARALAKPAAARFQSAGDFAASLRELAGLDGVKARRRRRRALSVGAAVLVVIAAVAGTQYVRAANRAWAATARTDAGRLASERRYREAFDLVSRARKYLPEDPALERIAYVVADDLSVVSSPGGAHVFITPASEAGQPVEARRQLGTTPLAHASFARGDYLLEIEKDGFSPVRRMISSSLVRNQRAVLDPSEPFGTAVFEESAGGDFRLRLDGPGPIEISVRLVEAAVTPPNMVFVPGGRYRLVAFDKPVTTEVLLDDYFIDRFEVTNRAFREFIDSGGYSRPELWSPAADRGRFIDRTGRPGPRSWTDQQYAPGLADHPVTDITWYEASAYARFRGAQLPTVFQWERAARDGQFSRVLGYVMPWGLVDPAERLSLRANFQTSGTVPVDSFPFGISPVGAAQMAGNVAEWCRNVRPGGYTVAGGSWQDPLYLFGTYGSYPALYAGGTIGFRTVRLASGQTSDQGAMRIEDRATAPTSAPVSDAVYRTLLSHYQYDRPPLDAKVAGLQEAPDWTREQITFAGAGGERAMAYFYLPKRSEGPVQVIHYVPSDAVLYGLTVPEEVEAIATPLIRAGRALFAVVNRGFSERPFPVSHQPPDQSSVRYREILVDRSIDLRRGLDYLATRPEVDMNRLAAFGTSIWSSELIPFALEDRYRAIILLSAGLPANEALALPEANAINFAPRIKAPTLMLSGRHDETISYDGSAAPLFELLPAPKSIRLFDGGHIPPLAAWIPVASGWLDEKLGPVRR